MKDEVASNCSHSVMSTMTKRPCEWEIHTKAPQKFGAFLTTDFSKEFEKSNTPWDCQCDKWRGYNRHILDETKIERIKKRVNKAFSKLERIDAEDASLYPKGAVIHHESRGYSQDTRDQEENLKLISNFSGFNLLLKVTGGFGAKGKLPSFPLFDIN